MENLPELEKLYDPTKWSPFASEEVIQTEFDTKAIPASRRAKQTITNETVSYGSTENQKIDIFGASSLPADAPIFVFIHGGYWMRGCREDSSFMVEPLFKAGFVCCVVGYELVPKVTICDIVEEIEEAVKMVVDLADSRGSRGIYICGHSAGAHLAAMLLHRDSFHQSHKGLVKGIFLLAGLYDLEPLSYITVGKELNLTREIITKCSPVKLDIAEKGIEVHVIAAKFDSPEFVRQSYAYYQALKSNGVKAVYTILEEDHFTIGIKLENEDYSIVKEVIQLANLK